CLAHTCGGAEKYAQSAATRSRLFDANMAQEFVRVGPLFGHGSLRLSGARIERQVQFQHIYPWLAEQTECSAFGRRRHDSPDDPLIDATRPGDATHLIFSGG